LSTPVDRVWADKTLVVLSGRMSNTTGVPERSGVEKRECEIDTDQREGNRHCLRLAVRKFKCITWVFNREIKDIEKQIRAWINIITIAFQTRIYKS